MEQVTKTNLPIVGRIQHGMQQIVNQRKRVTELGYFIARIKVEGILNDAISSSGQKSGDAVTITIEGELP